MMLAAAGAVCSSIPAYGNDYGSLVEASAQFAVDLYRELSVVSAQSPSAAANLVFSPYGVSLALAAALGGADGTTRDEIASGLHVEPFGDGVHSALQALADELDAASTEITVLATAVGLWVQTGFPIEPTYAALVQEFYGGAAKQVDFVGDAAGAAAEINAWARERSAGAIDKVLDSGDITLLTRAMLLAATHFAGKWAVPFLGGETDPSGTAGLLASFQLLSGETIDVPAMEAVAPARHVSNGTVEVLAYPYFGERLEFLVLLPARGAFEAFTQGIDGGALLELFSGLEPVEVRLTLPRFTIDSRWELGEGLRGLGILAAFSGQADFSGISSERLYIDSIIQTARIDVDEEGTRADSITRERWVAVGLPPELPRVSFVVDRPFLFAIWDRETRAILFLGHVVDPR